MYGVSMVYLLNELMLNELFVVIVKIIQVIILTANIELTVEIVEENELKTAVKAHTYETFVENE